jgi:hypothetical protein
VHTLHHALVGQEAPFDHGREQMKVLAVLEVTTKSVERIAEAIGEDIAQREQEEMQKAIQLDLPVVVGKPIPVLYVEMDGTGVPVVKMETVGRPGKTDGQPAHTREAKLGCVFTQTSYDKEGFPSAIRIRLPTPAPSRRRNSLANESTWKPISAAGRTRQRKSSSPTAPNGSGILLICICHVRSRFSISSTPGNTCGSWRVNYTPMMQ